MRNLLGQKPTELEELDGDQRSHVRDVVARVSDLRSRAVRTDLLAPAEERELFELAKVIRQKVPPMPGEHEWTVVTALAHLDKKQLGRFEQLVEQCIGDPGYFKRTREEKKRREQEERHRQQVAELARRTEMRRQLRAERPGSVVIPPEAFEHLTINYDDEGKVLALDVTDLGWLAFVLVQIEGRRGLLPGSLVEDETLIWDRTSGVGPYAHGPVDAVLDSLDQLAANDWLNVEYGGATSRFTRRGGAPSSVRGSTVRISRGRRLIDGDRANEKFSLAKLTEKIA